MAVEPVPGIHGRPLLGMERQRFVGYLFGVLTAACWATSPILIREGLKGLKSPIWGVTVGMSAAAVVTAVWLVIRRPPGTKLWRSGTGWAALRGPMWFMLLAGALSGLGAVGRTISIKLAPVVVAIPLVQTTSFFTPVFAPLLLGKHVEHVPPRLLLGALLVVGGSALVIIGLNA